MVSGRMKKIMKSGYLSKKPGQNAVFISGPVRQPARKGHVRTRKAILENRKGKKINKCISINSNSEIYGACRHRPKFHRYTCCSPSADEGQSPERGKVAFHITNPSVRLSDITNTPVCQRASKYSNIDVSTDLEIGYVLLSIKRNIWSNIQIFNQLIIVPIICFSYSLSWSSFI